MKKLLLLSVLLFAGCGGTIKDGSGPLPAKIEATIDNIRVMIVQEVPGQDSYKIALKCYEGYDLGARKLVGEGKDCTAALLAGKATVNTDLQSILDLAVSLSGFRCAAPE